MINGIGNFGGMMPSYGSQSTQQVRDQLFQKADTDSNGTIDKAEFQTFAQMMSEKTGFQPEGQDAFSKVDADSDGVLSRSEFDAGHDRAMEKMGPPHSANGSQGMGMFQMNNQTASTGNSNSLAEFLIQGYTQGSQYESALSIVDLLG